MKLWGGRFEERTDKFVEEFTASLPFDKRLFRHDIRGSVAHVTMLCKCGLITDDEANTIKDALGEIYREMESGEFPFDLADEDIHMAIERTLIDRVGVVGGKLHTARSRNDQVALDLRLFLREEIAEIAALIVAFQKALVETALNNLDVIMPGYTHLQRAQPVLFSHHIMAYFWMLGRDIERMHFCREQTDRLPLGSAALAGTTHPIDREYVAGLLGFSKICENSIDGVSDRDFIVEFLSAATLIAVHLSRLAEEIIIWNSSEFGFVELSEKYTTGSSIMPQKKNPDVAELIRGKSGRVFGDLIGMLTVLKGLPLAYNRDMQEDKETLFDAVDTVKACLVAARGLIGTMTVNDKAMVQAAEEGFANATDLADYLVGKGVPFRDAHRTAGEAVKKCLVECKALADLTLGEFKALNKAISEDVYGVLSVKESVKKRVSSGGTSPKRVAEQLETAKQVIEREKDWF
ncbi:MAG: argininosuccinate lyase [Actinobacteria bacterium]|nr:argininosuccinate lyase [Actinomycetota bacterium]